MSKRINKRILFTGIGRRVELIQAFREAALVLNKDLRIYGTDIDLTAPALVFCDEQRKVPHMKNPAYIPSLLDICKAEAIKGKAIDLIIPTIDTDLLVLSENKEKFEAVGTQVLISDADKIRICRDKNLTFQFFTKECTLRSPKPVTDLNDWKKYNFGYPAFIKPKDGSSSINAYKVNNEEELRLYASRIDGYIIQPFIRGREYTIDIFCDWNGNPVYIVPRERLQIRAGEVLKTRIDLDQRLIEECYRLCSVFKPCGSLAVQVIREEHGNEEGQNEQEKQGPQTATDWFIEINPRFGGGSPLSMKAGAKSAEAILRLLAGEKLSFSNKDIIDGAVYSRFDQSVSVPVCLSSGTNAISSSISTWEHGKIKGVIKGIIFDLDDTLYSEKEYVKSGFKAVSDYLGGFYEERLWHFFELGRPAIDELLKELRREAEKIKVLEIYRSHKPSIHLYPDVLETIAELKRSNIKIGLITDGRPEGQRNKITALGLENCSSASLCSLGSSSDYSFTSLFDDVIITDELGGIQFRKPCDIAFRMLLTRWKLSANEVAYVGDNVNKDFQAPNQLGMKSIWFKNKDGLYTQVIAGNDNLKNTSYVNRVDYTIGSISQIKEILPPPRKDVIKKQNILSLPHIQIPCFMVLQRRRAA